MDPSTATASKEDVKAQREARRALKLAAKHKNDTGGGNKTTDSGDSVVAKTTKNVSDNAASSSQPTLKSTSKSLNDENRKPSENAVVVPPVAKPTLSKAERRAVQEAQRLAKETKKQSTTTSTVTPTKPKPDNREAPPVDGSKVEKPLDITAKQPPKVFYKIFIL